MNDYNRKQHYNIQDNKSIVINSLDYLFIKNFRKFEKEKLNFGKYVTVLSGQNGTMKSTLMGLAVHPFKTTEHDINDHIMSTNMSSVFKWSNAKDIEKYHYALALTDSDSNQIEEPVEVVPWPVENPTRHRVTVSGHATGDGQLVLPVIYLNLKRLFPQVDMKANGKWKETVQNLSSDEKKFVSKFFFDVLQRRDFEEFTSFDSQFGQFHKQSKGPSGTKSDYDQDAISAGEDNLSVIIDSLISLSRIHDNIISDGKSKKSNQLTGILAIDEFDATLHPVSQIRLFQFIFDWARQNKVQVILNTHSLSLINEIITQYDSVINKNQISINFISHYGGLKIISNPDIETAYRELTLKTVKKSQNIFKLNARLEDEVAKAHLLRSLKAGTKKHLQLSHTLSNSAKGTPHNELTQIARQFPMLFVDSNSLVIFDADVSDSELNTIDKKTKFKDYVRLPSLYKNSLGVGLPIEKEIVMWLNSLDELDPVFAELAMLKSQFINEWTQYHIPAHLNDFHDAPVASFKNWYKSNPNDFWKIFTQYKKRNATLFVDFDNEIQQKMSDMYAKRGVSVQF